MNNPPNSPLQGPPARRERRPLAVALVVAVLALGLGIALGALLHDDPAPKTKTATVAKSVDKVKAGQTRELGGPGPGKVKITPAVAGVVAQAKRSLPDKALRGAEPGPGVKLDHPPLATPSQRGCSTRLVRNFSFRAAGVSPKLIVLHYTVSPRIPGTADVNGIAAFFDRPAAQASSNYTIDDEGHCLLLVGERFKAWTQGNMNSLTACSFEVINTGRYSTYIGPAGGPGLKKLGLVVSDCAKRNGIPLERGSAPGCSVARRGIVDHDALGCGNSHTDIRPYSVAQVIDAARKARGAPAAPLKPGQCHASAPYVRRIQAALNRAGARLDVDGDAGPKTRAAIRAYQLKHGLKPASGFAGPKTRKLLGVAC